MKLIIDISDKVYWLLKYFENAMGLADEKEDKNDDVKTALIKAVINGTPLDDVKADIKTYSIIKQNPIANRKVTADSIEVWKAKIIEKEHIKELLDRIRAEIDEQYDRVRPYNIDVAQGLEMALGILDNLGKESETN